MPVAGEGRGYPAGKARLRPYLPKVNNLGVKFLHKHLYGGLFLQFFAQGVAIFAGNLRNAHFHNGQIAAQGR